MPTRGRLTIDLNALKANWQLLDRLSGGAETSAVVKANGYGLGVEVAAPALWEAGARTFFVAHVGEAEALRRCVPAEAAVYVLGGFTDLTDIEELTAVRAYPIINSLPALELFTAYYAGQHAAVHFDTGMARLGFDADETASLLADPACFSPVADPLLMTHLVSADETAEGITARQSADFSEIAAAFPQMRASLLNSSGHFRGLPSYDLTRPGVALYGVNPTPETTNPMTSVTALDVPVLQVRSITKGDTVGYGEGWTAARDSLIATVPLGYADGFLRSLSDRTRLYHHGQALPLVGRVSMDLVTIDVTDANVPVQPGDWLEVWGDNQTIDQVAADAGTIGYELLTGLGPRYERKIVGSQVSRQAVKLERTMRVHTWQKADRRERRPYKSARSRRVDSV